MPIELIATVEDKSGDKGTTSIFVPTSTTLTQLNAFSPLWATALNDMIYGVIRSIQALYSASVAAITDNAGSLTADVEHVGKFQFRTVSGDFVNISVPCLDEGTIGGFSSDELDQTEAEVAAFIAAMESGIAVTGGTISPCDIGEQSISTVIFAREAFRNSGARK
jgi:hypothetical protein